MTINDLGVGPEEIEKKKILGGRGAQEMLRTHHPLLNGIALVMSVLTTLRLMVHLHYIKHAGIR